VYLRVLRSAAMSPPRFFCHGFAAPAANYRLGKPTGK
jgi:hypothetical protein